MARRRARLKPEDILWPVTERTVEAINHNFDILFRDLGLFDEVLPIAYGGTGTDSFDVGDVVVCISSSQLGGVTAVATGNALISQGVGVVPAWGKIGLTTHVSGVLPVANGGTNQTTFVAGDVVYAQNATTLAGLADVATGNALLSGGIGLAPAWGKVGLTTHVTGTLPIANGGTNGTTALAGFNNLSPLTTKGDLLTHDGVNNIRFAAGADGLFLKADSATASGLAWDSGGGTHEILQSDVHTDSETNDVERGALIVGASLPFNGGLYWIAGGVMPELDGGLDYGAQKYWGDGEAAGALGFNDPDLVKWRRLSPATGTLRCNGVDVYWGDDTVTQAKVKVFRINNLTLATGAGSLSFGGNTIEMEDASFDSHSFWEGVSNPERLTVPTGQAGIYLIVGQGSWASSASGRKAVWIFKNGSRAAIAEVNGDDGGLGLSFTVSTFLELAVGDYVELVMRQDSGGDLAVLGAADASYTQLQMVRVAL